MKKQHALLLTIALLHMITHTMSEEIPPLEKGVSQLSVTSNDSSDSTGTFHLKMLQSMGTQIATLQEILTKRCDHLEERMKLMNERLGTMNDRIILLERKAKTQKN